MALYAETALRRGRGLLEDWGDYLRRRIAADYRAVLRFEDELEVRIGPDRIGWSSITWVSEILRDGAASVDGRHTVVFFDHPGRPSPFPATVKERLEELVSNPRGRRAPGPAEVSLRAFVAALTSECSRLT